MCTCTGPTFGTDRSIYGAKLKVSNLTLTLHLLTSISSLFWPFSVIYSRVLTGHRLLVSITYNMTSLSPLLSWTCSLEWSMFLSLCKFAQITPALTSANKMQLHKISYVCICNCTIHCFISFYCHNDQQNPP